MTTHFHVHTSECNHNNQASHLHPQFSSENCHRKFYPNQTLQVPDLRKLWKRPSSSGLKGRFLGEVVTLEDEKKADISDDSQVSTQAGSGHDDSYSLERELEAPALCSHDSFISCDHDHDHTCRHKKNFKSKEERVEFNQKIAKMKKTEMCRNIIMYGCCKYGSDCSYAHT